MPKILLLLLTTAAVAAAQSPAVLAQSPGNGPASTEKQPRIQCTEPVWKFGVAPQHTSLKHEFVIKNTGEGELRITQVVPSCQCTAILPKKQNLQPGEETVIETTLNTLAFQGPLSKTITVVSNDPAMRQLVLVVTGDVLPPFSVRPQQLSFGKVLKTDASPELEFSVVITKGVAVNLGEVKTSNPLVEAHPKGQLEEQADGSRIQKYSISVKPGMTVGLLQETVTVATDFPAIPKATLPVSGIVEGELELNPKTSFNLGRVKQGESAVKEVELMSHGSTPVSVEGIDVSPRESFTAELVPVEEGKRWKIRVALKPDAKPGYHRGTLTLRTNCPGETQLQSFFYAWVSR